MDVEAYFSTGKFVPNDKETVAASDLSIVRCLEDPYKYNVYGGVRAQMDGGTICTVTNKLELLHDI